VTALLAKLDADTIRQLLGEKTYCGNTPLHEAAEEGHADVVKAFVEKLDADTIRQLLGEKDNDGLTPRDLATGDQVLQLLDDLEKQES